MYNDPKDLPADMPEELVHHIGNLTAPERNQVWITCKGEHPLDVENIGPIHYVSARGLPGYYFPYVNTPGYLSPLVAVQLERPKSKSSIFNLFFHEKNPRGALLDPRVGSRVGLSYFCEFNQKIFHS